MEVTEDMLQVAQKMAGLCFSTEDIATALSLYVEDLILNDQLSGTIKKARMLKSIEHWEKVDLLANAGDIEMIQLRNDRLCRLKTDVL